MNNLHTCGFRPRCKNVSGIDVNSYEDLIVNVIGFQAEMVIRSKTVVVLNLQMVICSSYSLAKVVLRFK